MSELDELFSSLDFRDFEERDGEGREPVEVEGWVKAATERAVLFEAGGSEVWIPRKLLLPGTDVSKRGDDGKVVVPRWFVEQEDLSDEHSQR